MFFPQRVNGVGRFQRWRRDRLANALERAIRFPRIPNHAVAADEFDARLFLCSFNAGDQNWSDLPGCADVRPTAGGAVVTSDVDHADLPRSFRRFAQSRPGKVFLGEISHRSNPILLNNAIRQVLRFCGLLTRYRIHWQVDRAGNGAQMKAGRRPIEEFDEGLGQHMLARVLLHVICPA